LPRIFATSAYGEAEPQMLPHVKLLTGAGDRILPRERGCLKKIGV
jgi:hypothetical protein